MERNSSSRFGLSRLRDGIEEKADELSEDANPRSTDGSYLDRNKPFSYETENYDRQEAPRDNMRDYWRKFETTPIVRKPITSFASRVTEPGYYIESEKLTATEVEKIGKWLDSCAIVEGQPGKDFRELAQKAVIQREVRGTALVEKAPHKDDSDRVAGLKLINPETVEAVTKPDQSVLMPPEGIEDNSDERYQDIPEAESGGYAAWLQDILETDQTYFRSNFTDDDGDTKIGFRRDEVIPLRRDADVGEIFGTSRIESVANRIEGLKNKLSDNDQAIASKAYPLYVFLFGDPETEAGVWDSDDIEDFMSAHEMENFEPGMKQGVRGDVSIETVSGDVAEIAEYLQFDVQWIMASMPMPLFLLGSFNTASVGQVAGVAQQQDVIRQISDARRELEEEFTPIARQVAKQQGVDDDRAQDIKLRFGKPGQADPEVTRSQQVIRYVSDAQGGDTQQPSQSPQKRQQGQQPAQQPQTGSPKKDQKTADGVIEKGETPNSVRNPEPDQKIAGVDEDGNPFSDMVTDNEPVEQVDSTHAKVWDARVSAELQDATSTDQSVQELAEAIHKVFCSVRDRTLETVENKYGRTPKYAASEFERIANSKLNKAVRSTSISDTSEHILSDEITPVYDKYDNSTYNTGKKSNVRFFRQNIEHAVRDAGEEMLRRSRKLVRDAVISGESWREVRTRVEKQYSNQKLMQRARLIAYMELQNAVETTKLNKFRENEDIAGVRVVNEAPTTPVTQSVTGAEAYFDEGEIDEQIAEQADDRALQEGFDPLPRTPPYHFNDTTTLEPIYTNEVDT
jgi:hypothetical protein